MKYFYNLTFRQIFIIAVLIHVVTAWFSSGHYHVDEHFSLMEFNAHKLGLSANLLPEFSWEIRSGLQPFIGWVIAKILMFFNAYSPTGLTFILRALSAIIALGSVFLFCHTQRHKLSASTKQAMLLCLLFAWVFVFYHVRFSSEGWGSSFFLLGLALYLDNTNKHRRLYLLLSGMAFAVSFLARYQMGFMLFGVAMWLLIFDRKSIIHLALGGILILGIGFLIDYWLYGHAAFPWLNYLDFHTDEIVERKRTETAWSYLVNSALILPPISLLFTAIIAAFCTLYHRHIIVWALLPYIILHASIDNIQMRFLYPVAIFLPLMAAMLWERYRTPILNTNWSRRASKIIISSSVVVNLLLLLPYVMLSPAALEVPIITNCIVPASAGQQTLLVTRSKYKLTMPFYLNDIEVIVIEDETELAAIIRQNSQMQVLYATRKNRIKQIAETQLTHQQICSALPDWVTRLNFNNWVSRASVWRVYKISS